MNMWMRDLALTPETPLQVFETSIVGAAKSELEKNAGEFSEYLDGLFERPSSTSNLDRFQQQTKLAQQMGRELAHREAMAKEAGIPGMGQIMSALKPVAGKALGWAAKNPGQAMAAGGAALGAAGGAIAGGPGNRMSGALKGGVLGGAAGYGASKIPGGVGQTLMDHASAGANMGLNRMGMQMKFAGISPMLGRAGIGAALGGIGGAIHQSQAERQGLAPGHHIRNALIGAAGGAAIGAGSKQIGKALVGAEHAAAPAATAANTAAPTMANAATHAAPTVANAPQATSGGPLRGITPDIEARQAARVKAMANSPEAQIARRARAQAAIQYAQKNQMNNMAQGLPSPEHTMVPHQRQQVMSKLKGMPYTPSGPSAESAATVSASPGVGQRPQHAGVMNMLARMNGAPQMAKRPGENFLMPGANFIKAAWSQKVAGAGPPISGAAKILKRPPPIPAAAHPLQAALKHLTPQGRTALNAVPKIASIQAEPGTPGGAQEPEAEAQFQSRPVSKPAAELYQALAHLSPKKMRGLQATQSGA